MSADNADNNSKAENIDNAGTTVTTTASAPGVKLRPQTKGEQSYLLIAHLSDAYTDSQLVRVTTDLEATSVTAIGAVPRIKAAVPDVQKKLPQHNMLYFEHFEAIAWALAYVCAQVNATEEENRALTAQAESIKAKLTETKNFLVNHAKSAGINMTALRKIGTEFGYKPLLTDSDTVIELLLKHWDALASKMPTDLPSPQAFDDELAAFRTALAIKEQNPEGPRLELIRRRRVNTLFRAAVADIREALIYTYGESRVGDYIPGFSNSSGKSGSRNEASEEEPEVEAPAVKQTASAAKRPSGFIVNNPDNLPITNPFIEDEDDIDDDKKRSA